VCDAQYVILLERLERQVLAEQQMTAALAAGGAKVDEPRTFQQARDDLDEYLCSDPDQSDSLRLLRELGVA
jgi:hypothetical protein